MAMTREQYMREQEMPKKERVLIHRETHRSTSIEHAGPVWGRKL